MKRFGRQIGFLGNVLPKSKPGEFHPYFTFLLEQGLYGYKRRLRVKITLLETKFNIFLELREHFMKEHFQYIMVWKHTEEILEQQKVA